MDIGVEFISGLFTGWLLIILYKIIKTILNQKFSSPTTTISSQNINEMENPRPDPIVEALAKTVYK